MTFRKSTSADYKIIDELLKTCFGDRSQCGALNNIDERYLLAFDDVKLIAMTGLDYNSPSFDGAEIDWTCLLPEYRGRGIAGQMIKSIIDGCDKDIYCSCLRLHDNKVVNLHYAMSTLGFQCIKRDYKSFCATRSAACNICVHKTDNNCECHEDLYVKKYVTD